MLAEALNVVVGSDDPPMVGTSLTAEYRWLAEIGVAPLRLWEHNLAAID